MSAGVAAIRRKVRDAWGVASGVLTAGAFAILVYLVVQITVAAFEGRFDALWREAPLWSLALAAVVYLAGHGFRILRLALLVGAWRVGMRTIASFHLMTAGVSLAAPLKLGEGYRVLELSNIVGGFIRAVVVVWWERVFDVLAILLMIVLAHMRVSRAVAPEFFAVAALAVAFIVVTAMVFFVVPDNLRRLSLLIIRRYDGVRTVPTLRLIDLVHRAIWEAPHVVRGKVASLGTLTALIWTCEIACFAIMLPALSGTVEGTLDALLSFLSAVTRGETLLGVLGGSQTAAFGTRALPYLAVTQVPLALLGLVAACYYIAQRMRS